MSVYTELLFLGGYSVHPEQLVSTPTATDAPPEAGGRADAIARIALARRNPAAAALAREGGLHVEAGLLAAFRRWREPAADDLGCAC